MNEKKENTQQAPSYQADPSYLEPRELIEKYSHQLRERAKIISRKLPVGFHVDEDDLFQDFCKKILAEDKNLNLGGAYTVMKGVQIDKRRKFIGPTNNSGQVPSSLEKVFASAPDWDSANNDLIAEALTGASRDQLDEHLANFRKREDALTLSQARQGNKTARKTLRSKLQMAVFKKALDEQGEIVDKIRSELDQAVDQYFEEDYVNLNELEFPPMVDKVYQEVKLWLELRISEARANPEMLVVIKEEAASLRKRDQQKALVLGLILYGYTRQEIITETGLARSKVNDLGKWFNTFTKSKKKK